MKPTYEELEKELSETKKQLKEIQKRLKIFLQKS